MKNSQFAPVLNDFDKLAREHKIIYSLSGKMLENVKNKELKSSDVLPLKVALRFHNLLNLISNYPDRFEVPFFDDHKSFLPKFKSENGEIILQILVPTTDKKFNKKTLKKVDGLTMVFNPEVKQKESDFYTLSEAVESLYDPNPDYWVLIDDNPEKLTKKIPNINLRMYKVFSLDENKFPYFEELLD
ncbi:hypothetical protein [Mycoplasma sp. Ms02]|uniref:hypothetical protein n=1 Tax=Mycoplasma sp. Ms02 TaxID=353851 RepID=UPI001C89F490|nr:hypothetical protein [Mycoplasma sp. Ms02]QZE12112.1 hypothetical protein K4L35_02020 [Mycoplasma sp. Ms02]